MNINQVRSTTTSLFSMSMYNASNLDHKTENILEKT